MIATGKCDTSLLEKYGDNDYVVDDDIVKKEDEGIKIVSLSLLDGASIYYNDKSLNIGETVQWGGIIKIHIVRNNSKNIADIYLNKNISSFKNINLQYGRMINHSVWIQVYNNDFTSTQTGVILYKHIINVFFDDNEEHYIQIHIATQR